MTKHVRAIDYACDECKARMKDGSTKAVCNKCKSLPSFPNRKTKTGAEVFVPVVVTWPKRKPAAKRMNNG